MDTREPPPFLSRSTDNRLFRFLIPLLPIVLLFGAVSLFFWKLLFTNLILARGDTFLYLYPYWTAAAEALGSGRLPLWNPDLFMGAPFLANSQAGVLYPLNWPLWLVFDTPGAASLSIVLHLWLASGFAYGFARSGLRLRPPAAWLAAVLFALGGYMTAQVEHINQLQGLAWLPAAFWLLTPRGKHKRTGVRIRPLLLSAVLAMQLLAGHTQAVFITIVGAAVYSAWLSAPDLWSRFIRRPGLSDRRCAVAHLPIISLFLAGLAALLLSAAQVLPTLELSRHSVRGGGLPINEAVSFSLHPLLVGRALLPGYGETIYSEYVAFLPLSALLLVLIGVWYGRHNRPVVALALVGALGLFFSLGAANPIYLLLVRALPGFGIFRAPARWLALYAFGAASLAGVGLDTLLTRRPGRQTLLAGRLILLLLIAWAFIAPALTSTIPAPPESPIVPPSTATLSGWLIELLLALFFLYRSATPVADPPNPQAKAQIPPQAHLASVAVVLFLASRALPYNKPTAPEAYHAPRPATSHLQAAAAWDGVTPAGRFLSISDILFDPGDTGELESIYADQLDPDALYDLIIASKQKDILAPNLPLAFGVPAVDGYDGGVLPLSNYVLLQQLLLPAGSISMDGRLRENLNSVPDSRWLDLFNVRYLITDKVGDVWDEDNGVFYDLQHTAVLNPERTTVQVAYIPEFEATGIGIASHLDASATIPAGTQLAEVTVGFGDGTVETLGLFADAETATQSQPVILYTDADKTIHVTQLRWATPGIPSAISIAKHPNPQLPDLYIDGLSLIDERDGAFQSLVVSTQGRFRLVHSGDVKIYENMGLLPRAFLVNRATWANDDSLALERMQAADYDPSAEVVLAGSKREPERAPDPPPGRATMESYRPERIDLLVEAVSDGWLVLSDAFYPGWKATVDGVPVPIEQANVLFRAIPIQPGTQRVVFTFRPGSVQAGLIISSIAWVLWSVRWLKTRREV